MAGAKKLKREKKKTMEGDGKYIKNEGKGERKERGRWEGTRMYKIV